MDKENNGKDLVLAEKFSFCKKREIQEKAREELEKYYRECEQDKREREEARATRGIIPAWPGPKHPVANTMEDIKYRGGLDFQMILRRMTSNHKKYQEQANQYPQHIMTSSHREMVDSSRRLFLANLLHETTFLNKRLLELLEAELTVGELNRLEPACVDDSDSGDYYRKKAIFHRLLK